MKEHYLNHNRDPHAFEPLTDHEIFNDVFNLQAAFNTTYFDSSSDASSAVTAALAKIHERLDDTEMIGKSVSLTGFDIIVPSVTRDPTTGLETMESDTISTGADHVDVL